MELLTLIFSGITCICKVIDTVINITANNDKKN